VAYITRFTYKGGVDSRYWRLWRRASLKTSCFIKSSLSCNGMVKYKGLSMHAATISLLTEKFSIMPTPLSPILRADDKDVDIVYNIGRNN